LAVDAEIDDFGVGEKQPQEDEHCQSRERRLLGDAIPQDRGPRQRRATDEPEEPEGRFIASGCPAKAGGQQRV